MKTVALAMAVAFLIFAVCWPFLAGMGVVTVECKVKSGWRPYQARRADIVQTPAGWVVRDVHGRVTPAGECVL